ncbi:hypothetical protein [Kribbella lupini]|uniref:Uncharacterized protein n=1 Tax=Kribbella lupini TaxID=291602 RepID=A0ABP4NKL6_9ACTN
MPLDIAKFNGAYTEARFQVEEHQADIAAEQAKLRELIPGDASAEDRDWAEYLVDSLAEPPEPPREWSALYHQAGAVANAAYEGEGSPEEKISAIEQARREIFAIAARAADDEAGHIRAMTRSLEHLEDGLRNPFWEEPAEQTN